MRFSSRPEFIRVSGRLAPLGCSLGPMPASSGIVCGICDSNRKPVINAFLASGRSFTAIENAIAPSE